MRERWNAMLLAGTICVALGGCATNNGPQLPYPYGAPPPPAPQPGTIPPPTTGIPTGTAPPTTGIQTGTVPPPTAGAATGPAFPSLKRPNWGSPGTIRQQRELATQFDPYGDNEAGPKIEGGRPREYDRPASTGGRAPAQFAAALSPSRLLGRSLSHQVASKPAGTCPSAQCRTTVQPCRHLGTPVTELSGLVSRSSAMGHLRRRALPSRTATI